MAKLTLNVLSLRYSSWSMRPWLALRYAGADFETETVVLPDLGVDLGAQGDSEANAEAGGDGSDLIARKREQLSRRRAQGSVIGLFPVLRVDGAPIHESLAICEWVADTHPDARLWPLNVIERARARAICCEMVSGFSNLRSTMSCQVFARVPAFKPDPATSVDIQRVFELWRTNLDRSGGPFLFGSFGIADCMYFPVLTRFRTYGIPLDGELEEYAERVESEPCVLAWREIARTAPRIPSYDESVRRLGGDPDATL